MIPRGGASAPTTEASLGFRISQRRLARALGLTVTEGCKFWGHGRWWSVPNEDLTVPLDGEVIE